ncbi:MAG: acyltransferase family protein [Nitrososphaerota archaeon]|jgi:surface polysaccharide O-acyltransferase-like enzyme|nr:acyltransferase family protein [Nitrososphaerota archaeon]
MERLNQIKLSNVHIDLLKTVAIIAAIMVHVAGRWSISGQELNQLTPVAMTSWSVVLIYQSFAVLGVPLFLMVSGLLLLHPEKIKENETLREFFKKRVARIGKPFLFWTGIYFVWVFLVQNRPFSLGVLVQGTLNGAYTQFWYVYVLFGLYILTPLLRVIMTHASQTLIKYFMAIWFISVSILPFIGPMFPYQLNSNVFIMSGYIGYFVLGIYLCSVQVRRRITGALMLLGISLTALATYVLAASGAGEGMYLFQAYLSPTVLFTAVMAFLLLKDKTSAPEQKTNPASRGNKLLELVSANTFGIFFVHVIVLETIQQGYLGFMLNREILNPIIEVPLLTVITLFVSLGIILVLRKIPGLDKVVN